MRKIIVFACLFVIVHVLFLGVVPSRSAEENFTFTNTSIVNENMHLSDCVAQADDLSARGDWPAAIQFYQQSIETALLKDPDYVCPCADQPDPWVRRYEPLIEYCRKRLLRMDVAALGVYRGRFELAAQRMLDRALRERKTASLEEVVQRYCLTKAGLEAARLLAEIAFERGEFERAWAGYEVLLEVWERQPPQNYAERDAHAALVARMAEVFGLMGDGASLERIEGMLAADKDLAARSVGVGGDASSLERHVARIRAGFRPRAEDPAELLATFGGDNTRGRMQPTPPGDPVSVEWRHKLKYDPRSRSVDFLDENNTYYVSMLVGPYAVGYKGNLLVANGYAITSLTEARGTENFVYDPYPFYEFRHGLRCPALGDACTLSGSTAYLTTFYVRLVRFGTIAAGSLHAIDLKTGKMAWRAFEEPYIPEFERVCSLPMLRDGKIYVETIRPNAAQDEYSLWCFDATTGKRKWRCQLAFGFERLVKWRNSVRADVIAVSGHTAIIESLSKTISAVDLRTGRQKWVLQYHIDMPDIPEGPWHAASERNWAYSPPMVEGHRVIVAPRHSSMVMCLDARNGDLLWKKSMPRLGYVAGLDGGWVFVIGQKTVDVLKVEDGKPACEVEGAEFAYPLGRPVLTAEALYFPTRDGLYKLDRATNKIAQVFEWSRFKMKAGNLVTTRGGFFVINYDEVVAFQPSAARP